MPPKNLPKKLKQIRLKAGLSQTALIRALNYQAAPLYPSQISQFERGECQPPLLLVLAYAASCQVEEMPQFAYCERVFLHPPTTGKNSYICAIAESSEGGTNEAGDYVIVLAGCHQAIELEF